MVGTKFGRLDFACYVWRLTSALISAVQQIAKGKMFSSAIVIVRMDDLALRSFDV